MGRSNMEADKEITFPLLGLIVLNSFLLLTSCGAIMTHRQLRIAFMRNLIEGAVSLCCSRQPTGISMVLEKQGAGLAVNFSNH
jgi:hypothetical protein